MRIPSLGFSLIELMVTVSVLAIVLAMGVPSFQQLISDNRMAVQANDFLAALNFGRSESIKRGQRITLCKSADLSSCTTAGNWGQGWIVFVDSNNNATADDGSGTLLKIHESLTPSALSGNTNVADYVSYTPDGTTRLTSNAFQAGTLTLCPGASNMTGRTITINAVGRARISTVTCT
jgi:type IV fimbrial biogenesis protein FimT